MACNRALYWFSDAHALHCVPFEGGSCDVCLLRKCIAPNLANVRMDVDMQLQETFTAAMTQQSAPPFIAEAQCSDLPETSEASATGPRPHSGVKAYLHIPRYGSTCSTFHYTTFFCTTRLTTYRHDMHADKKTDT